MKKTSIAKKLAGKKSVLIPLALSPVGVLLYVAVQSNPPDSPKQAAPQPVIQPSIATEQPTSATNHSFTASTPKHKPTVDNADLNTSLNANLVEAVAVDALDTGTDTTTVDTVENKNLNPDTVSNLPSTWEDEVYDDNGALLASFSVDIESLSDSEVEGSYCYISNYGSKIDCPNAFSGSVVTDSVVNSNHNTEYLIDFHSSFDNLAGQATITLDETELVWDLKKFPSNLGVSIPKHATLTKSEPQDYP